MGTVTNASLEGNGVIGLGAVLWWSQYRVSVEFPGIAC